MKIFKQLNYLSRSFAPWIGIGGGVLAIIILYFIFLNILKPGLNDVGKNGEYIGPKVPALNTGDQIIEFPYTDDLSGETIIIKSDKKDYNGFSGSDVYFTLTNMGSEAEKVALLTYFAKGDGDVSAIDVWQGGKWESMPIVRNDLKANISKLKKAFEKKKPVPEDFDAKAGTQFEIPAGHTAYFKSKIAYAPGKDGEFWIEALGTNGGYGLLDPWYSSSWSYRRQIDIDYKKVSGTSDLSNFPVLINITNSDFKHTSFSGKVASSSAGVTGGGGDFVFTSSNGTTKLDHEIEKYSSSSGELWAWVEVPTLSVSADTTLFVYYGGPSSGATNQNVTGVWDADYKGVYHLKESPTGTCTGTKEVCDSTSNDNDGDASNMEAGDQVAGKVGGSLDFGGTNEGIDLPLATNATTNITMSAWVYNKSATNRGNIVGNGHAGSSGYHMHVAGATGACGTGSDLEVVLGGLSCDAVTGSPTVALNTWEYYVLARGATNTAWLLYKNGVSVGTGVTTNPNTPATGSCIGGSSTYCDFLIGIVDEVRISTTQRSATWIATEYTNQNKPKTFATLSGTQVQIRTTASLKIGSNASSDTTPGWYQNGATPWEYRRQVVIDESKVSGASNLSNFPMLFQLTSSDLKHTSFGGKVASSSAGVTGGGGDFVFTSSDGTTKLDHEIEKYSSSSGELLAWVEIPTLSVTQDTTIYVYYGGPSSGATNQNPTGVWDSNYKAVYHEPDGTTLSVNDVTSSAANGTNNSSTAVAGQVDGGAGHNGSTQYISLGTPSALNLTGAMTIDLWMKPTTVVAGTQELVADCNSGMNLQQYALEINRTAAKLSALWGNAVIGTGDTSLVASQWAHVAMTRSGSSGNWTLNLYLNGSVDKTVTSIATNPDAQQGVSIARCGAGNSLYFNGSTDEVRISNTARSADWIKTEYTNQNKPKTFYSVSGLQYRTPNTTKYGSTASSDTTPGWYAASGNNWSYRKKLAIDKSKVSGSSDLSNFPLLVYLSDANIKHTSFSGKVASSSAGVTGGGGDFVFTSSNGTTKLDHEIEKYSSSSGELWAWVEVPTLSVSADTTLFVYYGGPSSGATNQNVSGTWNANYTGVWHMNDNPAVACSGTNEECDATSNGNHMNDVNASLTASDLIDGPIGKAIDFNGVDDFLRGTITGGSDSTNTVTMSAWIKTAGLAAYDSIFETSDPNFHGLLISGATGNPFTFSWDGELNEYDADTGLTLLTSKWYYAVAVVNGNTATLYLGDQQGNLKTYSDANANTARSINLTWDIANDPGVASRRWNGPLDEIRLVNTNLSTDWIKTEYTNQNKPRTFYNIGGQEARVPTTPGFQFK